ncbi:hypothetical protein LOK49_Contig71G00016 [Camellia lanceoleosa]|nr:hypothetical protein LOK49_Contig71G00016 [Camellia lanceoleosa]
MVNIPAWFAVDTRLGSLFVHLDTPQCFFAEMYLADLNIIGKLEHDKINLTHETLKGLLAHWLTKRRQRFGYQASAIGEKLFHMNLIFYFIFLNFISVLMVTFHFFVAPPSLWCCTVVCMVQWTK